MRETDDSDLRLDLERAIARLTPKQRAALWLWCQGYTQEEIAAALGIAHQQVSSRIWRGIARLRDQIKQNRPKMG